MLWSVVTLVLLLRSDALAFYDPGTQRWINRDPLQEEGGVNLYGFVRQDPIDSIDAFGKCPLLLAIPFFVGEALGTAAVGTAVVGGTLMLAGSLDGPVASGTGNFGNPMGPGHSMVNAVPIITIGALGYAQTLPVVVNSDYRPGSRPWDAPPGTIPIDQHPGTKDRVHPIKGDLRAEGVGPASWVGVDTDGNIIVTNPDGSSEDLGPHECYGR